MVGKFGLNQNLERVQRFILLFLLVCCELGKTGVFDQPLQNRRFCKHENFQFSTALENSVNFRCLQNEILQPRKTKFFARPKIENIEM